MISKRNWRGLANFTIFVAICCDLTTLWALQAAEPNKETKDLSDTFQVLLVDDFEGKLKLNWKPVREDESHVSLTSHPGKLTITTQRGTIHAHELADAFAEGTQAKNIYLIDNPLLPDVDFVATTCVTGFIPQTTYQQAGLIIYDNDDNYVKWGYEFDWQAGAGQRFVFVWETKAEPHHGPLPNQTGLDRYWVRITKRGRAYEYSSSTDGKNFTVHGEEPWEGEPKRIGLLAKNGGDKTALEMEAQFEFFELRSPAREPK
jgi:regulation of enolase protein 1 (concanavalin A-like superfamily)